MSANPGVFDPLAGAAQLPEAVSLAAAPRGEAEPGRAAPDRPLVQFWKPSALMAYQPPPNQNMVGDYHIQRGAFAVVAGPPGCGKSRAALHLALLGSVGCGNWLGFDVRTRFRTMMLQNENGLARLHRDLEGMQLTPGIDNWLRISAPPPLGLAMRNIKFRADFRAALADFAPDLLVVDPWNALARDAMEKDFQEAFDSLRDVLADSPVDTATLILHHLRKPKSEDRHSGRGLANLLAGSYTILSIPRSVIVLQPATDQTTDNRLVVTCAKNNDGQLGERTAWERREGGFSPIPDFDWEEYADAGRHERARAVQPEHIQRAFKPGEELRPADAVERLQALAGVGRSAAYEALKIPGPYSYLIEKDCGGKKIKLRDGPWQDSEPPDETAP